MASSLFNIGLSGLKTAQIALNTTSNNISNVYTEGYNRQVAVLSQSTTGAGVTVSGVERQYQQYLTGQLNDAQSSSNALDTQLSQLTQIDNLMADSDSGLAPLMQKFFSGLQTVADAPGDTAARQSLLGDADTMSAQFRSFADYLDNMGESVATQMSTATESINNYASQVAKLNKQITLTEAKTGVTANTLRDQRDQAISELSKLTNISVTVQDGNTYNVAVAGKQLVSGDESHALTMMASSEDPSRQVVGYVDSAGNNVEINESQLTGGTLGGLVQFRKESLEPLQNRIGQLTVSLAGKVNAQHEAGIDLNGDQGEAMFCFDGPTVLSNVKNGGDGGVTAAFKDVTTPDPDDSTKEITTSFASLVTASNYRITYQEDASGNGVYNAERLSDGENTPLTLDSDGNASLDGMQLTFTGNPKDGDSFLIKPTANAASSLEVAISDPAKIAAGEDEGGGVSGGSTDNRNAMALADLQNQKIVNGDTSFNSAYAQIVSVVGNATSTTSINSESQTTLVGELSAAQQSVSGVNIDEEASNLMRYQQLYSANAQVIKTASTLFDTLLSITN